MSEKAIKFKKLEEANDTQKILLRVTFISDFLGTKPMSSNVMQKYSQSLMTKADLASRDLTKEDKIAKLNDKAEDVDSRGTQFYKDEEGNALFHGQMFTGFLKEACKTLMNNKDTLSAYFTAYNYKTKIQEAFYVHNDSFWAKVNLPEGYDPYEDVEVTDPTTHEKSTIKRWKMFERPMRAEVQGREQVSFANSEIIPAGSWFDIVVGIRSASVKSGASKAAPSVDTYKWLLELLGECTKRGLGQWRNAGYGRFQVEYAELD